MSDFRVGMSITAGDITAHYPPTTTHDRHMLQIGPIAFAFFTPETAAQWLPYLTAIAEGNK